LTLAEAAELTRLSPRSLRRWHVAGRVHAVRGGDRGSAKLLFPRGEIARLLAGMAE